MFQDAVDFSNHFLNTTNRLPHPQEIWDAAFNEAVDNIDYTKVFEEEIIEWFDEMGFNNKREISVKSLATRLNSVIKAQHNKGG
jgi:hypothetical protein